jgi:hypothetical protein
VLTIADAPVIMGGVTIFAIISWWFTPEDAWLPKRRIQHFVESKGEARETTTEITE